MQGSYRAASTLRLAAGQPLVCHRSEPTTQFVVGASTAPPW
ncbi:MULTISPECIES: hypothetical protein [unclassified Streptomyces]